MATGDQSDMLARIKSALPAGWWPSETPILDGVLSAVAWMWSWAYSLIAYVRLQTRIHTATDIWLDLIALDYLGTSLPRRIGESDTSYRSRILKAIVPPAATRSAVIQALTDLTGRAPIVFEPTQPQDTGAYGYGAFGYGASGGYGSVALPFQAFVTAYRPVSQGVPNLAGYSGNESSPAYAAMGYGTGLGSYVDLSQASDGISDADIYQAIANTEPAGSILWARIDGGSFV